MSLSGSLAVLNLCFLRRGCFVHVEAIRTSAALSVSRFQI